jgi:uncharacterized membrane protein YeaQ/YmgE (transglycosylase-associated protein family)
MLTIILIFGLIRSIIIFVLVGLLAGWVAGLIWKGTGFGGKLNLIIGLIGSILGGIIFWILEISTSNILLQIISAVGGAVLFLYLLGRLKR